MAHIASPPAQRAPQLISLGSAAERFDVSVQTLRRRIADGTITGYRVGRLVRVDIAELTEKLLIAIPSVHRTA
ncbi:excisionase family DNA-binding protein [Xylanimonas protaetiae]|uniref:DNA-binding protein n=1 Tax=Xylanimonas protaetiae TaxID=2509457 RepID=A0A4V0YFT2_9MICO|nr:excisionase family DNA-binding protein [Xylanimonas protaetiae]QAY68801.1 DNA-binding protein [Xylanimonas protaetiae]